MGFGRTEMAVRSKAARASARLARVWLFVTAQPRDTDAHHLVAVGM